jgi:hypothetical protein
MRITFKFIRERFESEIKNTVLSNLNNLFEDQNLFNILSDDEKLNI